MNVHDPNGNLPVIRAHYADILCQLAEELGVRVRIEPIPREALYVADELFFTGTATEVMPIRSLDHITIADGKRGPVTEHIQTRYQDIINGRAEDAYGWMSYE